MSFSHENIWQKEGYKRNIQHESLPSVVPHLKNVTTSTTVIFIVRPMLFFLACGMDREGGLRMSTVVITEVNLQAISFLPGFQFHLAKQLFIDRPASIQGWGFPPGLCLLRFEVKDWSEGCFNFPPTKEKPRHLRRRLFIYLYFPWQCFCSSWVPHSLFLPFLFLKIAGQANILDVVLTSFWPLFEVILSLFVGKDGPTLTKKGGQKWVILGDFEPFLGCFGVSVPRWFSFFLFSDVFVTQIWLCAEMARVKSSVLASVFNWKKFHYVDSLH